MFTALMSLALVGVVVVAGFVYSRKMDDMISERDDPGFDAATR